MSEGKLIVIDGTDGSGKQTQTELLRAHFLRAGQRVHLVSFPRYTESFFGRLTRQAIDGKLGDFATLDPHLASLSYAADRWQASHEIKVMLSTGHHVICDRYVSANQIHQGGKFEEESERVEFLLWLEQLEYEEYQIPRPDISIYLDVPPEVSLRLMEGRVKDQVESNTKYREDSYKCAQWLIERFPERWARVLCVRDDKIISREEIHAKVVEVLGTRLHI
jgi:dTMP kinase